MTSYIQQLELPSYDGQAWLVLTDFPAAFHEALVSDVERPPALAKFSISVLANVPSSSPNGHAVRVICEPRELSDTWRVRETPLEARDWCGYSDAEIYAENCDGAYLAPAAANYY